MIEDGPCVGEVMKVVGVGVGVSVSGGDCCETRLCARLARCSMAEALGCVGNERAGENQVVEPG